MLYEITFQLTIGDNHEPITDRVQVEAKNADEARCQFYTSYGDYYITDITEEK